MILVYLFCCIVHERSNSWLTTCHLMNIWNYNRHSPCIHMIATRPSLWLFKPSCHVIDVRQFLLISRVYFQFSAKKKSPLGKMIFLTSWCWLITSPPSKKKESSQMMLQFSIQTIYNWFWTQFRLISQGLPVWGFLLLSVLHCSSLRSIKGFKNHVTHI